MQDALYKAELGVASLETTLNDRWYPLIHVAPVAGWLNDPNGLCYFRSAYHAYFQHNPFSADWGPMHWGHASSADLVFWKHEPIALAPSLEEDQDGVFSGSTVVGNDGELLVFYTGNRFGDKVGPGKRDIQVQMAARSDDGIHFEKLGVVVTGSRPMAQFRDPSVWQFDGVWFMIVGAQSEDGRGQVWQYSSDDLSNWVFDRVLYEDPDRGVYMLECPDLFALEDKWVLVYCPMGFAVSGYESRNGHSAGYVVGSWSPEDGFYSVGEYQLADWGHNYYAPQTFQDDGGRRISMAWVGSFSAPVASRVDGWTGHLSLPRLLSIGPDSRVRGEPLPELVDLRRESREWGTTELESDRVWVVSTDSGPVELELEVDLSRSTAERFGLCVHKTHSGAHTYVGYDDLTGRVFVDRRLTGNGVKGYRAAPVGDLVGELRLRIFIDQGSVEVFVNGSEVTLTSLSFPDEGIRSIELMCEAGTLLVQRLAIHKLASIWE